MSTVKTRYVVVAMVVATVVAGIAVASRSADRASGSPPVASDPSQLVNPEPYFVFAAPRQGDVASVTLALAMQAITDAGQMPRTLTNETAALTRFTNKEYGPV